jgi:hypothetical protein
MPMVAPPTWRESNQPSLQETQGGSRWTKPRRFRDREAPGSNPGHPTIFVFKTGDFARRREPTDHSRVTISCGASKPRRCNGGCRGSA